MTQKYFKVIFLTILSAVLFSSCVSTSQWTKKDFAKYAESKNGSKKFSLNFYGHDVNLRMRLCCIDYIDSRYTTDILPVREIKIYMENKYGVFIDISEFEEYRRKGHFDVIVAKNARGEKKVKLSEGYIALDGVGLYNGLISSGSWAYVNWSDYKGKVDRAGVRKKLEKGRQDQMQIFLETNTMGPRAIIWLRVRDGKPDSAGLYNLKSVAVETVSLPFLAKGCNIEAMAESIAKIPQLLQEKDNI